MCLQLLLLLDSVCLTKTEEVSIANMAGCFLEIRDSSHDGTFVEKRLRVFLLR